LFDAWGLARTSSLHVPIKGAMDDLAQNSPWRSRPLRDEPKPPFRSPLVLTLDPPRPTGTSEFGSSFAHRLGASGVRRIPRLLRLLS